MVNILLMLGANGFLFKVIGYKNLCNFSLHLNSLFMLSSRIYEKKTSSVTENYFFQILDFYGRLHFFFRNVNIFFFYNCNSVLGKNFHTHK